MSETQLRSGTKSFIWRILGVIVLATVTYAYTRRWITTGIITVLHHGIFLLVFYLHERAWLRLGRIKNLFWQSVAKMFTYETLLGNLILGTVTWLVTGNWKEVTNVTLTYIGIKHVMYIWNEIIWDKIKAGKKKSNDWKSNYRSG